MRPARPHRAHDDLLGATFCRPAVLLAELSSPRSGRPAHQPAPASDGSFECPLTGLHKDAAGETRKAREIGTEDVTVADLRIHQLPVGEGYGRLAWVWSDSIFG